MKQTAADTPRRVVLGVTGSIAAYKACEGVRGCLRRGWDVRVVMTEGATNMLRGGVTTSATAKGPRAAGEPWVGPSG